MRISEQWLREWVNPPLNTQQLAEQLTMAGLEIETISPVAGKFTNVVIGKVITASPHPDADRLRVCQVDVGQTELLTIVCGAANVRADLKVAVALIGANLPGDFTIKAAKLRGVSSQGMICSASELNIEASGDGIMELAADAPIGTDFRRWSQLDDHVLDVHITPNRGDCLSIAGLARELAALNQCAITAVAINPISATITDQLPIRVHAPEACPRYLGRVIRNINPDAQTPPWMSERLRRSGINRIHPVVDVTNYILLELGQPLHAFDFATLNGGLEIRFARDQEHITVLDGREIILNSNTLVIADTQQAQAIAGIMGGLNSAVSATTRDIFLECAFFNPIAIAGRARRYGLDTDGAYRFERGVDPHLPLRALARATELLLTIAGGEAGPVTDITATNHFPPSPTITLSKQQLERVLGTAIATDKIVSILQQLGMQLSDTDPQHTAWEVTPPSYRYDITRAEDLIEELARIHGYDQIPDRQPYAPLSINTLSEKQITLAQLRNTLIERGYHEAITYSFISPKLQNLIDPEQKALTLLNPISNDLSVMRTSLWPGLLSAAAYNQNRQQSRVRLFETGLRFIVRDNTVHQEPFLAGIITGNLTPEQWGTPQRAVDFFDLKNDLETLFSLTAQPHEFSFRSGHHSALHSGQTSAIYFQNQIVGYCGALHPGLLPALELNGSVYLFELSLAALSTKQLAQFKPLSKFPAIRRDLSFWIDQEISIAQILQLVRKTAGEWLQDLCLFDVYQDKRSDANKRSLALGLIWQHPTRTLVDDEINELMQQVVATLKQTFTIELRD